MTGDLTSSRTRRGLAARAALIYTLMGAAWILLSDLALYRLIDDPEVIARLETTKGWAFVGVSAIAVYAISIKTMVRLQRMEAAIRAVVNSIADGVLLVGRDKNIAGANPAAVRMLQVTKEVLVGMTPEEFGLRFRLSHPDGRVIAPEDFASQRALRGEVVAPYKAVLYPKPDQPMIITATSAPVRTEVDGAVDMVVSVMRDQTQLEQLDQMRNDFFAAAAHSLKTPLAVIKGQAQLLASEDSPVLPREAAAVIDRQCGRVDRLVQNLLVASRLRTGTLQLHPSEVELPPLVAEVSRELQEAAVGRVLVEQFAEDIPTVFADPERVAQSIRNFVDVACQQSPAGTAVTLVLASAGSRARVGIRSHAGPQTVRRRRPPWRRPPWSATEPDPIGALDVGQRVSEELVRLQGGRLFRDAGQGVLTTWIELPSMPGVPHGRG